MFSDTEIAMFKTNKMHKDFRKFKVTIPYHSERKCEEKERCVWHSKTKKR